MYLIKKLFKILALLVVILIVTLYITDTDYLLKAVRTIYLRGHKTAFLDDYKRFDNRDIANSVSQPWANHKDYNSVKETETLAIANKDWGTIAYVIIKNDSIWFENYYGGYDAHSKSNSFSMAKSYVSGLMGKAIMQGHIKSLDQPVGDFIPEFSKGKAATMTVGDLSSMASGTNWDEAYYSPLSITTGLF